MKLKKKKTVEVPPNQPIILMTTFTKLYGKLLNYFEKTEVLKEKLVVDIRRQYHHANKETS
jgi:hypothetical protein